MKIRSEHVYNFLLVMIVIYNFVIWNNTYNIIYINEFYRRHLQEIEMFSDIVRYMIYSFIILIFMFNIKIMNKYEKLLFFLLFLIFILKQYKEAILQIIMLMGIIYIIKKRSLLEKRVIAKVLNVCVIGIAIQLLLFSYGDYRRTLSITDPNFSAYIIFLLFLLLDRLKKKVKYVVLCLGLVCSSRSYLLSLIVYLFFKKVKIKQLKKFNYINLSIFLFIISCFVGIVFLKLLKNVNGYDNSPLRVFNVVDGSNKIRFKALYESIIVIIGHIKIFFLGLKQNELKNNYQVINTPHNTLLKMYISYGVVVGSLVYFYINKLLFRENVLNNFSLMLSLLLYQTFLPIGYDNISILLLPLILIIDEKIYRRNNETMQNINFKFRNKS